MGSGDLLGVGVSGLLASQRALSTTSHNVANVNTEGYSRQRVDLATRNPQFSGAGFIGQGVQAVNIRRMYDEFLTTEIQDATAAFAQFERFHSLAAQVDNQFADAIGGLNPAIQRFFDAVQSVADEPSSASARQVLLSEAQTLVDRFEFFDARLDEQYANVNRQLSTVTSEINSIAASLADLNRSIVDVNGGGAGSNQVANDLLDRRDQLMVQLSEFVSTSSVEQDDGSTIVYIGNGQVLVNRFAVNDITVTNNMYDSGRKEVAIQVGSTTVEISDHLAGGAITGAMNFRDQVLDPARNALGRMALALASDFNAQHQLGMDLNGQQGGDFFTIQGLGANGVVGIPRSDNQTSAGVNATITDVTGLTTSDYELEYLGGTVYGLTRLSDGTVTRLDSGGAYPFTSAEIDGITLTIAGGLGQGDVFRLRPTANAASTMGVALSSTFAIAAAGLVRTESENSNTGTGLVDAGSVTDAATYVRDTYSIYGAAASVGQADGAIGTITDNNNDSTLQYELAINGTTIYTQTEGDPVLADATALAAAINGAGDANVATTGVKAYVDPTDDTLYLVNVPSTALPITITETLNTTAGTVEDGDTVTGYFGTVLTGVTTPTADVVYGRTADSYVVVDSAGNVDGAGTYTSGGTITFDGTEVTITGVPNLGDTFTVEPNTSGVADNRNALALAGLQIALRLENGTSTYQDGYGTMIATVATQTRQAELNRDAQDALLSNALSARAEVSGVNLDEEAADLMKFQQAYMASAQVISAADTLFQALLGAMRR